MNLCLFWSFTHNNLDRCTCISRALSRKLWVFALGSDGLFVYISHCSQQRWDISWKGDWHFVSSSGPSGEIVHLIQFLRRSEFMCESWNEMHLLHIHRGSGNASVGGMQKWPFDKVQLIYGIIFVYSIKENLTSLTQAAYALAPTN